MEVKTLTPVQTAYKDRHKTIQKLTEKNTVLLNGKAYVCYSCLFLDNTEGKILDKDLRHTADGGRLLTAFKRNEKRKKDFLNLFLGKKKEKLERDKDEADLIDNIEDFWPSPEELVHELKEVASSQYIDKEVGPYAEEQKAVKIPEVRN